MAHFLLIYDLAPDYLDRRPKFRGAHLKLAWEAADRGDLLIGGVVETPVDSAVLLFEGETEAAARAFATADPYVVNGLVEKWQIRPWITVVGEGASAQVRS